MRLDQKVLQQLNEIGRALSREHRIPRLLELILKHAMSLIGADGGTIYTIKPKGVIHFEIAISNSLGLHMGGTSGKPMVFQDLPLFLPDGTSNDSLIIAYAVNHKKTINIDDVYIDDKFDFTGPRTFDERMGYRTKAVLSVPIKNHEDVVIAGLQLINPLPERTFSKEDIELAESLASQAGVALTNRLLINTLRNLFESLIRVVAEAVDEKSPSTGNHSKRVPIVAGLLADAVDAADEGPFKDVHFTDAELYEIEIASFLHDCGKITTPVHIAEKETKLQTIFDRIELIRARYDALYEKNEKVLAERKLKWIEVHYPKEFADAHEEFLRLEHEYHEKERNFQEDLAFIEKLNRNELKYNQEALNRLQRIAQMVGAQEKAMLTPNEFENLTIPVGNLTEKEREIIEHHVVMTYKMLSQLDFPRDMKKVPEIAASHHERFDGKGYPRGLKGEDTLLQARILIIADIFEALSAPDRPYRAAAPLSKVFEIMQEMVETGHLDANLFDLFLKKKVYLPYARQYLSPDQIDTD